MTNLPNPNGGAEALALSQSDAQSGYGRTAGEP